MDKVTMLKAMHELIMATTDEDILDVWFMNGITDEDDFKFIAEDEESFKEVVNLFIRLSKHFKDGLHLFGAWYK